MRARRTLGAGDLRVQVAGALVHYRRGDPNTAIGVLRALASNDDRAPVPALHLGLALLWAGQRGEATSELEQTRPIDPDGFYGSTADDVLHPSYRKGYPLWLSSQPVSGSLAEVRARAAKAPRSLRAQLGYAYSLQFQSRTRARVVAERALALDATNIDAQVAVIVLGFDKDQPAQAVGRLAQLMRSRPRRPEPALPLRRAALLDRSAGRGQEAVPAGPGARSVGPDRALRAQRAERLELISSSTRRRSREEREPRRA